MQIILQIRIQIVALQLCTDIAYEQIIFHFRIQSVGIRLHANIADEQIRFRVVIFFPGWSPPPIITKW